MLRKFKNSYVATYNIIDLNRVFCTGELQIVQTEKLTDELILVESVDNWENLDELKMSQTKSQSEEQSKIDEYRAIVLNSNQFNGKWSNKTLGELFDAKDTEFIDKAIHEMKNEYIRTRIEFLKEHTKL